MSEPFELFPELPPRGNASRPVGKPDEELEAFAKLLKEHPDDWGLWPRELSKSALSAQQSNVKRGNSAAFRPEGAWDAKVRGGKLYVKYVG